MMLWTDPARAQCPVCGYSVRVVNGHVVAHHVSPVVGFSRQLCRGSGRKPEGASRAADARRDTSGH